MADIPAGRRKIERGEHLFTTGRKKRCGQHRMSVTSVGTSGPVVACMVCGKLKQGETMPARWEPILPYPLTVIRTRYGGTYEGDRWAAFNVETPRVPPDAEGDDVSCCAWWAMAQANGGVYGRDLFGAACVAVGGTPDDAIAKLTELCAREGAYIA